MKGPIQLPPTRLRRPRQITTTTTTLRGREKKYPIDDRKGARDTPWDDSGGRRDRRAGARDASRLEHQVCFFLFLFYTILISIYWESTHTSWDDGGDRRGRRAGARDVSRLEPQDVFYFLLFYTISMTILDRQSTNTSRDDGGSSRSKWPQVYMYIYYILIILMCSIWFIAILYLALIPQVIVHVDIVKMT